MTLHAGFYSTASQLDALAVLLDIVSTRLGDRDYLQQGRLAAL
jgi:hypothetical protein